MLHPDRIIPGDGSRSSNSSNGQPPKNWVCDCGSVLPATRERCGNCYQWRGGKRGPYAKGPSSANGNGAVTVCVTKPTVDTPLGIGIKQVHGRIQVFHIAPDGLFDGTDLAAGMVFRTVNGRACTSWDELLKLISNEMTVSIVASYPGDNDAAFKVRPEKDSVVLRDGSAGWKCGCGNEIPASKSRCSGCNRWRGGRKPIVSAHTVERDAAGRALCRAVGCDKVQQGKCDGFCRRHFTMSTGSNARDSAPPAKKRKRTQEPAKKRKRTQEAPWTTKLKPKTRDKFQVVSKDQVDKGGKGCVYATEVIKRAKAKSREMVRESANRGEASLAIANNEICHKCHRRNPLGLTFHCGKHTYCDMHCATKLGFRAKDYDGNSPTCIPIDHCPVCVLDCTCARCTRRLDEVASKLREECRLQGCGVENVVVENLFDLCSNNTKIDLATSNKSDEEDEETEEWVQCTKCEKWRRLPPHIAAKDLADDWYCSMNTWNSALASCEAAEDEDEDTDDKDVSEMTDGGDSEKEITPFTITSAPIKNSSTKVSKISASKQNSRVTGDNFQVVPKDQIAKGGKGCVYAAEVIKRAKDESHAMDCGREVSLANNELCHFCHKRKPFGLTFHCGKHTYCDMHCATKLGFRAKDYGTNNQTGVPIDYCPVCVLDCTCAKCSRRLESVASKLKEECNLQGCGLEDVVLENLYELCSNQKISLTAPIGNSDDESDEEEEEKGDWVRCKKCKKLRRLPPHISALDLKRVWYCSMNTWDATLACEAEKDDNKEISQIVRGNVSEKGQSSSAPLRPVKYVSAIEDAKNKSSEEDEEGGGEEWVQCTKCEKWRRLPPHIAAKDMADVWYCSMNTWNSTLASCEAAEEDSDDEEGTSENERQSFTAPLRPMKYICKAAGCKKYKRSRMNGFCHMHFNMFCNQVGENASNEDCMSSVDRGEETRSGDVVVPKSSKRIGDTNKDFIDTQQFVPGCVEHFWECSRCRSIPIEFRAKGSVVFNAGEPPLSKVEFHLKKCKQKVSEWKLSRGKR